MNLPYWAYVLGGYKDEDERRWTEYLNSDAVRHMGPVPIAENPFFGGHKPRIEDDEDTSRYV